jgi:hypothetical protein
MGLPSFHSISAHRIRGQFTCLIKAEESSTGTCTHFGAIEMRKNWLAPLFLLIECIAADARPVPRPPVGSLSILDLPESGRIRVVNRSHVGLVLYYDYIPYFGDLQMFLMRFRDRHGIRVPITDAPGAWFTPHMRYASLRWPPRRRLAFRPGGSLEFARNIASAAAWASWNGPVEGPCEVQLKLFGYLAPRGARFVEFISDWHPAPCPDQSQRREMLSSASGEPVNERRRNGSPAASRHFRSTASSDAARMLSR